MNVPAEGHRARMRQRMSQMKLEEMRPQDIVEYLLYYALPRRDTKPQAYELVQKFGTLEAILNADEAELTSVKGIGPRAARWLRTVGRLMTAYAELLPTDKPFLGNLTRATDFLREYFSENAEAQVWQFCLNAGGWLIGCMKVADFACWRSSEYTRGALEQAILMQAHSVLLCCYSGDELISIDADERTAIEDYGYSLSLMGIQLLDHITLSRSEVRSMVRANAGFRHRGAKLNEVSELMCDNALESGYLEE